MVDRNSGDLLPPGWSVEERVRNNNGVTLKPTLSVDMDQSSNLDATANDQQIRHPACPEESMSISEHISNQCCTDGAALDLESAETKHEAEKARNSQRKHKHKKEINFPRRASKRLAGVKLDPVPELKTSNRPRRVAVKEAVVGEVITNVDKSLNFMPNGTAKQIDSVEGGSDTNCKIDGAKNTMESGQCEVQENQEHVRILDAKLDYSLDLPLGELLTDPCIAFAIQTLTGVTFESCKNSQKNSELRITKHSEISYAADEGHNKEIKLQDTVEHAVDGEIGHKANENSRSSSSESPIDTSWMDPCIEFAIKTLTETDPNSENNLQRKLIRSSNAQGHCEMA